MHRPGNSKVYNLADNTTNNNNNNKIYILIYIYTHIHYTVQCINSMQHHDFDSTQCFPILIVIFFRVAIQSVMNINELNLIGFASLTAPFCCTSHHLKLTLKNSGCCLQRRSCQKSIVCTSNCGLPHHSISVMYIMYIQRQKKRWTDWDRLGWHNLHPKAI